MKELLNGLYRFLTKNGVAAAFLLGVVIVVVGFLVILGGLDSFDMLSDEEKSTTTIFNFIITAAIVLAFFCALFALAFGLIHLVMNPKGSLKFVLGFVAIIALVFVFYSTATPETSGKIGTMISDGQLSPNTSKWISGALATTLVLLGGTFLVFVVSEVRNVFK